MPDMLEVRRARITRDRLAMTLMMVECNLQIIIQKIGPIIRPDENAISNKIDDDGTKYKYALCDAESMLQSILHEITPINMAENKRMARTKNRKIQHVLIVR